MVWKYKFEEFAGYDSMSSAYDISDGDEFICVIDFADFKDNKSKAEKIAKLIVDSVNEKLKGDLRKR